MSVSYTHLYKDVDGDGVISTGENTTEKPGDRVILGNNTPRFKYGITLDAAWKGVDFRIDVYKRQILRQAVDGAKGMDTVWNIVEDNIAYCENKLLNGQVDCNSSSRTTNVAHFLKLECMQQLVRDYREFANILSQTPPEENLQQTAKKQKRREKSRLKERDVYKIQPINRNVTLCHEQFILRGGQALLKG